MKKGTKKQTIPVSNDMPYPEGMPERETITIQEILTMEQLRETFEIGKRADTAGARMLAYAMYLRKVGPLYARGKEVNPDRLAFVLNLAFEYSQADAARDMARPERN